MSVAEILRSKGNAVFSITPQLTLARACAELEARGVGALVVCDGDRVAGVFSERDVVRALAQDGARALDRPVSAYMTEKVIFAEPREEMSALMARMTDRRIRHLPVMADGRLAGVVSIGDVVKHHIAEVECEASALREYIETCG